MNIYYGREEWKGSGERERRDMDGSRIYCVSESGSKKRLRRKKKQKTNTEVIVRVGKSVIKTTISKSR